MSFENGWLQVLLDTKFFSACESHSDFKKNERNIFCIDCCEGICQHCIKPHSKHRLLQVRRYVYHDVIRLQDLQKLVSCQGIQPYIINSARVVFLNQRPQPRPNKISNLCVTCERTLQDDFQFCSLGCKVEHMKSSQSLSCMIQNSNSASSIEMNFSYTSLKRNSSCLNFSNDEMNHYGYEDFPATSSGSTGAEDSYGAEAYNSTDTFFFAPKKSRTARYVHHSPCSVLSVVNRRKGVPRRSAF